jgi:hypothetical protein
MPAPKVPSHLTRDAIVAKVNIAVQEPVWSTSELLTRLAAEGVQTITKEDIERRLGELEDLLEDPGAHRNQERARIAVELELYAQIAIKQVIYAGDKPRPKPDVANAIKARALEAEVLGLLAPTESKVEVRDLSGMSDDEIEAKRLDLVRRLTIDMAPMDGDRKDSGK